MNKEKLVEGNPEQKDLEAKQTLSKSQLKSTVEVLERSWACHEQFEKEIARLAQLQREREAAARAKEKCHHGW